MKRLALGLFLLAWAMPGETVRIETAAAQAATIEGTWSARTYVSKKAVSDPNMLQFQINLDENGQHWNNWGQSIPRAAFTNLPADLDGRKDVTFELRREAGLIAFRGQFEGGRGVGYLTFTPNREFARVMEQQTNDTISDRELFSYAILDVSRAFVSELQAMGFRDVTLADARKLRIHGTTTDFIKRIQTAGYPGVDLDEILQLRIHGVTPEFIAGLEAEGLNDPSLRDVLQFRIHGVTLDYIKEMRALGFAHDLDDIVQSRIHGVTPKFAREMADLGYKNADFDQLRQFRIHGVTPSYVKEMAALGYRDVGARTIVQFRIHGITPSFVKELKDAGYTNLSEQELVDWAIHGRRLLRTKGK